MRAVEFIEAQKTSLYDHLNSLFSFPRLEEVGQATLIIDRLIATFACNTILQHSHVFFDANDFSFETRSFTKSGVCYELEFSDVDIRYRANLPFIVLPRTTEPLPREANTHTFKLPVIGKYETASFTAPSFITADIELIAHLIADLFWVGYSWLDNKIVEAVRQSCQSTNRDLYRYIEAMLPEPGLLDGFWFSAAATDKDFVILDDFATLRSLQAAKLNSEMFGRSAANIVTEVVAEVVPIKDSVIRDVCATNSALDLDLTVDPYYVEKHTFRQALNALWGKRATCFPIVTEGQFLLVAFYPTSVKTKIEPFLVIHKPRLGEIAQTNSRSLIKNLEILHSFRRTKLVAVAELAGAFFGAYTKASH